MPRVRHEAASRPTGAAPRPRGPFRPRRPHRTWRPWRAWRWPMRRFVFLACLALLGGCAAPPKDDSFGRAQQLVSERIGQRIQWDRNTADDRAAAEAAGAL